MKRIPLALITFLTLSLWASAQVPYLDEDTIRQMLRENPGLAGGTKSMYPEVIPAHAPAPKGYKVCYISHYGRHGARLETESAPYDAVHTFLKQAHKDEALTEYGESVYRRFEELYPSLAFSKGDLTLKGQEQHRGIAARMCGNYPSLFKGKAAVAASSSVVPRCVISMTSFLDEIRIRYPKAKLSYSANMADMYYNGLVYNDFPTKDDLNALKKSPYMVESRAALQKDIELEPFFLRLCKSMDYVNNHGGLLLASYFWSLACNAQCMEPDQNYDDLFTDEERYRMWRLSNLSYAMMVGRTPATEGILPYTAQSLLGQIVTQAGEDLASGSTRVRLRFGHDTAVGPLMSLLGIEGWTELVLDPQELASKVHSFDIPMASNLQFVFYRSSKKPSDILLRLMYNEQDQTLPLPDQSLAPYYRWEDFRDHYQAVCSGALEKLSAAAARSASADKSPSSRMEKKIDSVLSGMSLDEKIGQMILLESAQVAYKNPQYDFRRLMTLGRDELDAIIREAGLQDKYNADKIVSLLKNPGLDGAYACYTLSMDLSSADGFSLDEERMKTVFGEYHTGSILNMMGTEGDSLRVWREAIATLEKASMKYNNGLPVIYGLDQVHGPTYIFGGTMFPQQIGLAATFNPELVKELGAMNAYETRAGGIRWVYGPSMDLAVKPSWPRVYETWGEDPLLTGIMATSYMQGVQGPDSQSVGPYHAVSCLKHYLGYGSPDNGLDRTTATISEPDLREKHFEPFRRAVKAGAMSVMTNSSVVNGEPGVCNKRFLTDWLKEELAWDGVVVTDWGDVSDLFGLYKVAADKKEAIALAVNAGVDVLMVPSSLDYGPALKELVNEGQVSMKRIDDAVRRILRMKYRAGLFDDSPQEAEYPLFGSEEYAAKAYRAAVESEVLLKNDDGVLPLRKGARILVCGPNANTLRGLNGGWTYSWQGSEVDKYYEPYNTILEAFQGRFGARNVIFEPGVEYDFSAEWQVEKAPRIDRAVAAAKKVDYIVACVGENSYAETRGNVLDLELSENQQALVKALCATGKPVILVINSGRPRIVSKLVPEVKAVVDIMLPGNYGGDALAALLAGDENFSGKLPMTYPAHSNALTTYSFKVLEDRSTTPGIYNYENHANVQWWLGDGISYTSFSYSNFVAEKTDFKPSDNLTFSVDVTNTGGRAGQETVLLFSSDDMASGILPDNRRLRAFRKISLEPGETQTVRMTIPARDLAFVGPDGRWHLEKGGFTLMAGGQFLKINCTRTEVFDRR